MARVHILVWHGNTLHLILNGKSELFKLDQAGAGLSVGALRDLHRGAPRLFFDMSGKVHPKVWTGHIKQAIVSTPHQSTAIHLSENLFYPLAGFQRCPKGSFPHPALQRTAVSKCNFSPTPWWKKVINADNADGWIKPVLSSCRFVFLNHMILSLILQSFGDREERREELMYFGHGGVCSHIISVMNSALFVFVKLRPQQ